MYYLAKWNGRKILYIKMKKRWRYDHRVMNFRNVLASNERKLRRDVILKVNMSFKIHRQIKQSRCNNNFFLWNDPNFSLCSHASTFLNIPTALLVKSLYLGQAGVSGQRQHRRLYTEPVNTSVNTNTTRSLFSFPFLWLYIMITGKKTY